MSSRSAFQSQPFKALYVTYVLATTYFVAVPLWYLQYAIFGTKRPNWTIAEQVKINTLKRLQLILEHCRIALDIRNPAKEVKEDSLKESSFVWLKAPRKELIKGAIDHPVHKPLAKIAGFSWPKGAQLGQKDGKVMLFLHGGGYYVLHAGEKSPTSDLVRKTLQYSTTVKSGLSVEYRTLYYGGFPSQVQDAFAGYAHLVDTLGIDPKRIVVAGDSAGGHLALTLIRYLKDSQALPQPGKLLLFSPWSNMDIPNEERPNLDYDYLRLSGLYYTPDIYQNNHDKRNKSLPAADPYCSPTSVRCPTSPELFSGFPKTFIHYGECETLANDAQELKKRMDIAGVDVTIYEEKDAIHDSLTLDWFRIPHQRLAWSKICDWLDA